MMSSIHVCLPLVKLEPGIQQKNTLIMSFQKVSPSFKKVAQFRFFHRLKGSKMLIKLH